MAKSVWKSVEEAREFILSRIVAVGESERTPLRDALGRVLAEDVAAPFDVPGFDNSAMDGHACRIADLPDSPSAAARPLREVGAAFAGRPCDSAVGEGECARIMTGARIPQGADIVIPQEEIDSADGKVVVAFGKRKAGMHIRLAGEDLREGEVALSAGKLCMPADIGLLGSLGKTEVVVKRRLRVAFFSTGDELKSPGEPLLPGEIYDSNRHTIFAMLRRMGAETMDLGTVGDCPRALSAVMDAAQGADAAIASGGASVGEADFIRPALAERGEVLFWKVAMRPGRPLAYGKLGTTDFFGLPGNPVSVMVCFYQFAQAALWKRAGRTDYIAPPLFTAKASAPIRKSPGRAEYQRGILRQEEGEWRVSPTGDQGSGILSSMTRANCFIVLEESRGNVAAGEEVQVQLFDAIF